jgi:hypothetical protein
MLPNDEMSRAATNFIELLLNVPIQDGIEVMLDVVFAWANLHVPPEVTEVSEIVKQYVKETYPAWYYADIDSWLAKNYREALIGGFYRTIKGKIVGELRQNFNPPPQRIDKSEREQRIQALAEYAKHLPIRQALNLFEAVTVSWVDSLDLDAIRSYVGHTQSDWSPQKYRGYIFYIMADVIEH